jgi:hypothetical protein
LNVGTSHPDSALEIDPFAFTPAVASRIIGLGGVQAPPDGTYAFHTPYVFCAPGDAIFTLKFTSLHASIGNLTVRINAVSARPGANARTVKMTSKSLRDIAFLDGELHVSVSAKPDTLYAIFGSIYGPSDASAEAMTIFLDRPDDGSAFDARLLEARRTIFGQDAIKGMTRLIATTPATLADPISQMCTAAQFDEPAFDHWCRVMHAENSRHRKQWEFVYILQSLSRYGMIEQGARGLGFGCGQEPLPAIFAAAGCSIVATDLPSGDERAGDWSASGQHTLDREILRRPHLCPDARFDEAVTFQPVDMNHIPNTLAGFDFCWSACALEHLGSIQAGLDFIRNSLDTLHPGGLAVHTTEFNLTSNSDTLDHDSTVLFRRKDFERLALDLVASGHEVAQFNYDQGNAPIDNHVDMPPYSTNEHLKLAISRYVTTSFGIIIRKGAS